jgi:hypothetical protein
MSSQAENLRPWVLVMFFVAGPLGHVAFHAAEPATKPRSEKASGDGVMRLTLAAPKADLQGFDRRIYLAAERLAHCLLADIHPWQNDPQYVLLTESRSDEHWIRPNTGALQGFCFLYRFGPYQQGVVGVSRDVLMRRTILPMLRYLVATHITGPRPTGDGKHWGDAWQSAYWAQMLGRGAWWIWDELPADVRGSVRRVVAHEADRIAASEPPHQVPLDTKAEENAWNSRILEVAVLLMPHDSRRAAWDAAFQRWALSSFLRPADEHSQTIVDGRPICQQFTGANIHDDFTLENHDIVHPDYMGCIALLLEAGIDFAMSGRRPPDALFYNTAGIYENLKWFSLPSGAFVYPNGQDWELFRSPGWMENHLMMAVYGHDADAWSLACGAMQTLEKMQARWKSGAVYGPQEFFFPSTHTDLLNDLSLAWLALQTADRIDRRPCVRVGVRRLDAGKIILHRTGSAVHTFSWGRKLTAQCILCQLDQLVSPDPASGVGHITLKGAKEPLPVRLGKVEVTSGEDWFAANVVIEHGKDQVQAELSYRSDADGVWTMRERLVARADLTTSQVATGLIGILNNPGWVYERGQRIIRIDGKETVVPALGGRTLLNDQAHDAAVDSRLQIHSARPLRVRYVGATRMARARATDELDLNYLGGEHTWHKGQVISEYEVTVRCPSP